MDRLVHATEIRVLPCQKEADRLLAEIRQRENCVSASYRRLNSGEVDPSILQVHDRETVDFVAKLTDLNVPVYLFEWDVVVEPGNKMG